MARVRCTVVETRVKDANGKEVGGVRAECMRCDRVTTAIGTGEKSIKRCLSQMHQECELDEDNFYVED